MGDWPDWQKGKAETQIPRSSQQKTAACTEQETEAAAHSGAAKEQVTSSQNQSSPTSCPVYTAKSTGTTELWCDDEGGFWAPTDGSYAAVLTFMITRASYFNVWRLIPAQSSKRSLMNKHRHSSRYLQLIGATGSLLFDAGHHVFLHLIQDTVEGGKLRLQLLLDSVGVCLVSHDNTITWASAL